MRRLSKSAGNVPIAQTVKKLAFSRKSSQQVKKVLLSCYDNWLTLLGRSIDLTEIFHCR